MEALNFAIVCALHGAQCMGGGSGVTISWDLIETTRHRSCSCARVAAAPGIWKRIFTAFLRALTALLKNFRSIATSNSVPGSQHVSPEVLGGFDEPWL